MGLKGAQRDEMDRRIIATLLQISSGISLGEALDGNDLTHFGLKKNFHRFRLFPKLVEDPAKKKTLEDIAADPDRLFLISEAELKGEYDRVEAGQQEKLNPLILHHTYNRQFLAFYAVASTLPSERLFLEGEFSKDNRELLVSEILGDPDRGKPGIPSNHLRFFNERNIGYLISRYRPEGLSLNQNAWALIDGYYMRKTGDSSLFDPKKKHHLPDIKKTGWGRAAILGNPEYMANRVYDILTKKTPKKIAQKLDSKNRKLVIEGLDELAESPGGMVSYFRQLGLGAAMVAGFNGKYKNSPKAIYAAFDHHYRKVSRDKHSLFDVAQPDFSPLLDPKSALANEVYVDKLIYNMLIRIIPGMGLISRSAAANEIKKLPHKLAEYFRLQGFRQIVPHTYLKDLPFTQAVITGYIHHLRRISHGVINLFDKSQSYYVSFDRRGTLKRKNTTTIFK